MPSLHPSLSLELLAANQRLHQLREQLQANKSEPAQPSESFPWDDSDSPDEDPTAVDLATKLPNHLGWESDAITDSIRASLQSEAKAEHLTADHSSFRPIFDGSYTGGQQSDSHSRVAADNQHPFPINRGTVRHYPTIGIAALKEEQAAIYRVWLLYRYLDQDGRGWLAIQDIREKLTDMESKLRLFTWRRLRQVLGQGHSRFWIWDKERERLWLFGAARIATNLDVNRLVGKPVALPVSIITNSIGEFKAHLYATWHSGRKINNPISRFVQEKITSIPERTQRHYCHVARITRKTNIAIVNKNNPEEVENQAWQRGKATFHFIDHHGQQGQKGTHYIAWHLPNTYIGPHQQSTTGRMRKINRKLAVLVNKGTQGNRQQKVEKRYFVDGKDAVKALGRSVVSEAYWPFQSRAGLRKLWTVFS